MPALRSMMLLIAGLICAGTALADDTTAYDTSVPNPAPAYPELRPVLAQFGGQPGLKALMDDFMTLLLADPRTEPFFAEVEHERVKLHLTEQFCVILGGDCEYTGMDMVTAHTGLDIRHGEFNALVELLQVAMERRGIPSRAQNKLLAKLAPMHREVISAEIE
jgi:hemoglobin